MKNKNGQGWKKIQRVAKYCVVGCGLAFLTSIGAVAAEETGLFSSNESLLGSTREHLSTQRYSRLLPVDYNLRGEAVEHWQILNDLLRYQPRKNQLKLTQKFFSTIKYVTDKEAFDREDYWASIGEFMSKGGDCEDFVIAKYRALVDAGYPAEDLRVVLVEDMITGLDHAVLSAELDGRIYILDNQRPEIIDAKYVNTYRPLYSMNQYTIWLHSEPASDAFVTVETKMPTAPAGQ